MQAYIIRRVLLAIPTLIMVTMIIFSLVRFIPGNVLDLMLSEMASEAALDVEATTDWLRHKLGMDVPVYHQYARWVGFAPQEDGHFRGLLQGDMGSSLWKDEPVREEIFRRLPVSMEIGVLGMILAILWAIPIGTYAAIRQDTLGDYAGRTVAITIISVPSFWIATLIVVYPAIWWGWMPPVQLIHFTADPLGNFQQFLIPAAITGLHGSGSTMRMTRTMMLEVLRQDYIRTAWAKGLNERTVILRHALKNAMIPVVTLFGMQIPLAIAGTVVMETIFALPGMGLLMIEALNSRDYPVISGINVITATVVLMVNLVVDLTYAWLDPRVSYK